MNKALRTSVQLLVFMLLAWPVTGNPANGEVSGVKSVDNGIVELFARAAILELCQRSPNARCEAAKNTMERVQPEKYFYAPKKNTSGQQILAIYADGDEPYFPYVILFMNKDGLLNVRTRGTFATAMRQQLIDTFMKSGDYGEVTGIGSIDDEIVEQYSKAAIFELCQGNAEARCEAAKRTVERVRPEKYIFVPEGYFSGQQILTIYANDDETFFPHVIMGFDNEGWLTVRGRGMFATSMRQQLIDTFLESGNYAE